MKITSVETAVIEGNFDWVLVRITTDTGATGLGEAYWGTGVAELVQKCAPQLIGEDPRNIGKLTESLVRRMSGAGSQGGATVTAISGIDLALWDLVARSLDTPISTLFGGRFREKIRIYADCHAGEDETPESWAERARAVRAQGFSAMKFDLDVFNPFKDRHDISEGLLAERNHWLEPYNRTISTPERQWMVAVTAAIRDAIGPEIMLAMDLHWKYTVGDAIKLARELEPFDLLWLEDPVPPENIAAHAEVQRNTKTPICTGENLYRKGQYRELIEQQAVRIISPDIPKMGGLLEAKKVADHADQYYIPIAPHNVASPVGTVSSAHVCAAMSNFLVMEFHANDVPWWSELVEGEPVIKDGFIHLTEAPGHGLTLNEPVAREHAKPGTTFFGEAI